MPRQLLDPLLAPTAHGQEVILVAGNADDVWLCRSLRMRRVLSRLN